MTEGPGNIEIAHQLHHMGAPHEGHQRSGRPHGEILEIIEAILLALVAVATAWSGYQAARWDGASAESYAAASRARVLEDEEATLGELDQLHDISTFNAWLPARASGQHAVADLLERRFSTAYQIAFKAWLLTDPLKNPDAPPGPMYMPEYRNPRADKAAELSRQADEAFEAGRSFRENGEDYVRLTVFLATVLFLIAVSQRFKIRAARQGLLGIAGLFLALALYLLAIYPTT